MDYESQRKISPYLNPNEKLLWSGRPKSGIVFRSSDIAFIPFSLLWTAFFIFLVWEFHIYTVSVLVVLGFHLMIGRFVVDSKLRTRTYYGLTDNRIIIMSGYFRRKIESLPLDTLQEIKISTKTDGSGTITLEPSKPVHHPGSVSYFYYTNKLAETCLEFISDARNVYNEILSPQEKFKKNRN